MRLLARGLQTKQVARALGVSVKTADHHVQHAYAKIGVSTRAGATLFAMEHGLLAWGRTPRWRALRAAPRVGLERAHTAPASSEPPGGRR